VKAARLLASSTRCLHQVAGAVTDAAHCTGLFATFRRPVIGER
jgi:hypothetical protein